jgi:hypothetical protein
MNEKRQRERVRRSNIQMGKERREGKERVERESRETDGETEGRGREKIHLSIDGGKETRGKRQRDGDRGGEIEGRTIAGK